jgi:hypothetical protein
MLHACNNWVSDFPPKPPIPLKQYRIRDGPWMLRTRNTENILGTMHLFTPPRRYTEREKKLNEDSKSQMRGADGGTTAAPAHL